MPAIASCFKLQPTEQQMTMLLFLPRCVQLGISIWDLDLFTIGMVNDMYAENGNDEYKYPVLAVQETMDKFQLNSAFNFNCRN